jgi:hypothetical protein
LRDVAEGAVKEATKRYYVETRRGDGTWVRFTIGLMSEAEGEDHLAMMQAWATKEGQDPERARLRRLNDKEYKQEILTEYREKFAEFLASMPLSVVARIAGVEL